MERNRTQLAEFVAAALFWWAWAFVSAVVVLSVTAPALLLPSPPPSFPSWIPALALTCTWSAVLVALGRTGRLIAEKFRLPRAGHRMPFAAAILSWAAVDLVVGAYAPSASLVGYPMAIAVIACVPLYIGREMYATAGDEAGARDPHPVRPSA
jgi:hypothetical protein